MPQGVSRQKTEELQREARLEAASAELSQQLTRAWLPAEVHAALLKARKREQFARWYAKNKAHCKEYERRRWATLRSSSTAEPAAGLSVCSRRLGADGGGT